MTVPKRRDTWHRLLGAPELGGRPRCADADPEIFFPEPGDWRVGDAAKAICADCPVREPCLEYALSLSCAEDAGIWGGTSERERRRLRRTEGAA